MYLRLGRLAYCSDSRWISWARRAISSLRSMISRSLGARRSGVSGVCGAESTLRSACRVVSNSVCVGGEGRGAPFSVGRGAMPGMGFGTLLVSESVGRLACSDSPPPLLLAWARKSALSGALPLAACSRITSSAGSDGAAFSMLKVMPSASTAWATTENRKVTPKRSAEWLEAEALTTVGIQ
jgi:hypothetical protein